ncbi:MAG TPA: lipid A biosynthesis lauroyl acyltransferase [Hypericibacter adhaerens]|uniref:Lipid A biosynthesis lauroyl acyltransferase n=1 Tax=Hypericibacter adhaerens TaxID=2602016 RepID=A0A5J6N1U1_9PROT|nr:lipid A biosynthesis lauroyl acyltransferase [Hypericibacter adhaerens]QEX22550.1 lipid A biosynthesis lauroyl acyltransferase [Hypericibacter adhaerens]HWA44345.1 lipid A biosynthesis lauroyl acyltransferase [Hypericibacter adhaerens]
MSQRRPSLIKRFRQALEGALLLLLWLPVRWMPIDWASGLGGGIARVIGPWFPVSGTGRRNLKLAFPDKSEAEIERILEGAWDNLGRYALEYPHLKRIWDYEVGQPGPGRVEVAGVDQFLALRDDGKPALIFAAHLGNWELLPVAAARHGLPVTVLYKRPRNPVAAEMLDRIRRDAMGELISTGIHSAIAAVEVVERGGHLGMLVDQHANLGPVVPFFGNPVRTAPLLAKLARRYQCPLHGARVERLGGARFRATLTPPLEIPVTDDVEADVEAIMTKVTSIIEGWVRERPEQWLWLHRRWRPLKQRR